MEKFDKEGNLTEDGLYDKEGKLLEDPVPTDDELHKAAADVKEGDDLFPVEDDDQLFIEDENLDDLFEDIPLEETEEERIAREKQEAEDLKNKDVKVDNPLEDENRKLRLKIKEMETGKVKKEPVEIPADDTPMTVGGFKKLQADIQHNAEVEAQDFNRDYVKSFYTEAINDGLSDKEADVLFDFIRKPENATCDKISYSAGKANGIMSGVVNFNKGMRAFTKEKALPLKHQKTNVADLRHGNGKVSKSKKRVNVGKLDAVSQRFIKSTGMSEEDQVDALATSSSIYSKGGRQI